MSTACPAAGGGILRSHVGPGLPGRVCRWPASSSETEPSSGDPPHCPPVDIVDPCFVPVWWVWNGAIVVLVCALTAAAAGAPTRVCMHVRIAWSRLSPGAEAGWWLVSHPWLVGPSRTRV